ncbi:MAG: hypothetical protein [Circoviridae sp.]|nr:MAG: hypothetical protein [Circoviridae sp.]
MISVLTGFLMDFCFVYLILILLLLRLKDHLYIGVQKLYTLPLRRDLRLCITIWLLRKMVQLINCYVVLLRLNFLVMNLFLSSTPRFLIPQIELF